MVYKRIRSSTSERRLPYTILRSTPGARVPSELCSPCNLRVSLFFKVVTFPPLFLTCSTVILKASCLSLLVNAYTVFFSLPSKDPLNKNNTIWIQSILSFFVDFIARVLSNINGETEN